MLSGGEKGPRRNQMSQGVRYPDSRVPYSMMLATSTARQTSMDAKS